MLVKGSYWPGGGASTFVTAALASTGAAVVAAIFEAGSTGLSGISTDFQSSSASTVRAIKVPTLISFVPSGI